MPIRLYQNVLYFQSLVKQNNWNNFSAQNCASLFFAVSLPLLLCSCPLAFHVNIVNKKCLNKEIIRTNINSIIYNLVSFYSIIFSHESRKNGVSQT